MPLEIVQTTKRKIRQVSSLITENNFFMLVLLAYVILAILVFQFYRYNLYPDAISYVSIANSYLNGHFHDAVNGYFAPVYSWLLIPFLFIGFSKLMSIKILSLLIGLVTVVAMNKISYRIKVSNYIRQLLLFISVPIILYFALYYNTPDLLLVCILLFYFDLIYKPKYIENSKNAIMAGALGAFSYFSKHYALPFFIAHFILMNGIFYFQSKDFTEKKRVFKNFAIGMTVFLLFSGAWVGLISHKYNEFTISTSARYVYALMRPETKGHPIGREGFLSPGDENATSVWEDPSELEVKGWNPIQSIEFLKHQIKLSLNFIKRIVTAMGFFSVFSFSIILGAILFLVPFNLNTLQDRDFYILSTLFLFNLGYVFILPVERYLWIDSLLILLLGGSVLHKLFKYQFFGKIRKSLTVLFFASSFLFHPFINLALNINKGKEIYLLSRELKKRYNVQGTIVSQNKYKKPFYLAFYLNLRFLGPARDGIRCEELFTELKSKNIDYYLVWEENRDEFQQLVQECDSLLRFKEITNGEVPGLRVYDVKNRP